MPYAQRPFWITSFALRTHGDPRTLAGPFRDAVASLSPDAPVLGVEPLTALVHRSFAGSSHRATILGLFSALAMTLAAIGIYGLVAYAVAARANEIGVRMALGAERRHVRWLVLRHGLHLTLIGTALGLAISLAVTRWLATMLFGVRAADPVTFAGVATLLLGAAAAACYLPARRATRIDPLTALRCE
jgi:putative ABC transport system permease protein